MKVEFIKNEEQKSIGYKLIPEDESEQYQLNEIRNNYFFGSVSYDGREKGCEKFSGNLKFKFNSEWKE